MPIVTIHQAKTNLSKLISRAEAGEEIIIARGREAVVRLEPIGSKPGARRALVGTFRDRWPDLPDSFFFDPLPEEELRAFEGRDGDELLVDTHAFFWWMKGNPRLTRAAADALEDSANRVLISAVVAWELATKSRIGKWPEGGVVVDDLDRLIGSRGLHALPITIDHARLAGRLPAEHRDPFDRMLAAQSLVEDAPVVSADPVFSSLGTRILW